MAAVSLEAAALSISLDASRAVQVIGVTAPLADWTRVFQITVDQPDAPPLAGTFRYSTPALIFTPRYPLQPGQTYRIRFGKEEKLLRVPDVPPKTATTVERVFPTTAEWPENLLRFYVHFSAPMSRGEAFARLHLIDLTAAREVPLPFLEIQEELWDRDQRRLTVLFDPGRVKRGLVPHNEVGPPLVAGRRYRLIADAAWRDATNAPLGQAFAKDFTATAAVRQGIEMKDWSILPPRAGSREPLQIDFPRPLDAGLLASCLSVLDLPGETTTANGETRWLFTPREPWPSREFAIEIGATLEDVAGNRLDRAFDVDLDVFQRVEAVRPPSRRLTFRPR